MDESDTQTRLQLSDNPPALIADAPPLTGRLCFLPADRRFDTDTYELAGPGVFALTFETLENITVGGLNRVDLNFEHESGALTNVRLGVTNDKRALSGVVSLAPGRTLVHITDSYRDHSNYSISSETKTCEDEPSLLLYGRYITGYKGFKNVSAALANAYTTSLGSRLGGSLCNERQRDFYAFTTGGSIRVHNRGTTRALGDTSAKHIRIYIAEPAAPTVNVTNVIDIPHNDTQFSFEYVEKERLN